MSKADEVAVPALGSHRGGEASDYEASRRKTYPGCDVFQLLMPLDYSPVVTELYQEN